MGRAYSVRGLARSHAQSYVTLHFTRDRYYDSGKHVELDYTLYIGPAPLYLRVRTIFTLIAQ